MDYGSRERERDDVVIMGSGRSAVGVEKDIKIKAYRGLWRRREVREKRGYI